MAYSLADLISEVQSKIGDTSFPQADLITYANRVNSDIHTKHKLSYMEAKQDYTTNGVALLGTLPTDFLIGQNLRLTDIQYAQKLSWKTVNWFDENYPQPTLTAPSVPFLVYDFARSLYLFPTPQANPAGLTGFGVELRYWKKPTKLTLSTDIPDVPEEFSEVVMLGMLKRAYEKRQRFDVSQLIDQDYQDRLGDLLTNYSSGMIQDGDPYIEE